MYFPCILQVLFCVTSLYAPKCWINPYKKYISIVRIKFIFLFKDLIFTHQCGLYVVTCWLGITALNSNYLSWFPTFAGHLVRVRITVYINLSPYVTGALSHEIRVSDGSNALEVFYLT